MMIKKRLLSMLVLLAAVAMSASAAVPDKVYYRVYDYSDGKLTYTDNEIAGTGVTEVTSSTTEWTDGTYVVTATTTISSRITVTGTVNLIILDGATLTAEKGITVSDGNTLNIYMGNSSNSIQSTGQLNATAQQGYDYSAAPDLCEIRGAGIGGYLVLNMMAGSVITDKRGCGNVNIHGGKINVQNESSRVAGIGGSDGGAGGNITIYYSKVTAYGREYVSAIGAGQGGSGGTVAIYGGDVNAIVTNVYNTTTPGIGASLTVGKDVQVYALSGSKSPDEDLSDDTNVAPEGGGQVTTFNNSMFTRYTGPYGVALKSGTEDAASWQGKAGTGDYQSLPLEGVAAGMTVSVKYSGTKMVKSVKAVKKAAGPEVTTFSELQAALSAGKDVKLMNDIVCTAEIEITGNGALTIDGNGKKLSTTSAIRAFKVGSSATVAFKNLTLTGFVSGGGPAINNNGGTIVLDGCTISNCHVNNTNGGGAIENQGKMYAINTTFSGNYSGEIGGAINNYGGSLYMSGCTFTDNYTTKSNAYYGGAIGINMGSEVRLINCAFSGNKYGTNTGTNDIGVFNNPTNYTIAGCTGATIASRVGDITTNASGTATLDYSDLSNISFTVTVTPAAAESHALSVSVVGEIVGTDGLAYAVADKDNLPSGVTAAGMVAYKSGSNGLAIALADEASQMNWSTANGGTGAAAHTPTVTGYSWKLPSMDEWNMIVKGLSGQSDDLSTSDNYYYTAYSLKTKIEAAGGTGLQYVDYWSSTEYSGEGAWFFNASSGKKDDSSKGGSKYVRSAFAF